MARQHAAIRAPLQTVMVTAKQALLDLADIRAAFNTEEPALRTPELAAVQLEHCPGSVDQDDDRQDEEDDAEDEGWAGGSMDDDRLAEGLVDRGVARLGLSDQCDGYDEVSGAKTDEDFDD